MSKLKTTLRAVKQAVTFPVFLLFFFLMLAMTRECEGEAWDQDDFEE
jgi:hypothetical protein